MKPPPRADRLRKMGFSWFHMGQGRARFTTLFERLAIDVLLETDILGTTRILRISWDEAWHIHERAVARGQQAKPVSAPAGQGLVLVGCG
jgi:hypothetical protein